METIKFVEKRKATKWPAIIVLCFLILGGSFVAYAIKFEDSPQMLGFSVDETATETDGLESVEKTDAEKLEEAMAINYEIKDVSSSDTSDEDFVSNIHLPKVYVDGKELTQINEDIQDEYVERFESLRQTMQDADSSYSFNVTYTYFDNIVGLKKVVSLVVNQQIIDTDSQKVTSQRVTTYNIDLSSKETLAQDDVLYDMLGKDYKDILKEQVKEYIISNGYATTSSYNYEITGLENFYIKDSVFHIVFNGTYDSVADTSDIIDIEITAEDEEE